MNYRYRPLILSLLFVRSYDCLYWTTLSFANRSCKTSPSPFPCQDVSPLPRLMLTGRNPSNYLSLAWMQMAGFWWQCDETASAVTPGPQRGSLSLALFHPGTTQFIYFIIISHLSGWQGGFVNHNVEMAVGVWLKLGAGCDWAGCDGCRLGS